MDRFFTRISPNSSLRGRAISRQVKTENVAAPGSTPTAQLPLPLCSQREVGSRELEARIAHPSSPRPTRISTTTRSSRGKRWTSLLSGRRSDLHFVKQPWSNSEQRGRSAGSKNGLNSWLDWRNNVRLSLQEPAGLKPLDCMLPTSARVWKMLPTIMRVRKRQKVMARLARTIFRCRCKCMESGAVGCRVMML